MGCDIHMFVEYRVDGILLENDKITEIEHRVVFFFDN